MGAPRTRRKRREPVASISLVICSGDRTDVHRCEDEELTRENERGVRVRTYVRMRACACVCMRALWYIKRLRHFRYSCSNSS